MNAEQEFSQWSSEPFLLYIHDPGRGVGVGALGLGANGTESSTLSENGSGI
jgi:hypothetical protein